MRSEKKVLYGVIAVAVIGLFLVLGISLIFGESITGNAAARANVNVTSSSSPPQIVFVSGLNETVPLVPLQYPNPRYLRVSFLAFSAGGSVQLSTLGTSVSGYFNQTGTANVVFTSCATSGASSGAVAAGVGPCPNIVGGCRNYTCDFKWLYYYNSGNWTINMSVTDTTGKTASNNTVNFTVQPLYGMTIAPVYVNWSTIQLGGAPKASDNNITANNTGNMDLTLKVNGTTLHPNGVSDGINNISGSSFETSGGITDPCAGISLNNNAYVTIPAFNLIHTSSTETFPNKGNVAFCLNTISGIAPNIYQTISPGGDWSIDYV